MKEQELRFHMFLVTWWQGGPLVASSWAVSLFVLGHREVTVEWGFCGKVLWEVTLCSVNKNLSEHTSLWIWLHRVCTLTWKIISWPLLAWP